MYADFQRDLGFLMQNTGAQAVTQSRSFNDQVTLAEGSNRADFRGGPDEVESNEILSESHWK